MSDGCFDMICLRGIDNNSFNSLIHRSEWLTHHRGYFQQLFQEWKHNQFVSWLLSLFSPEIEHNKLSFASDGTGCWNLSWWKTRTHLSYVYLVNIITAEDLVMQGARTLLAMVLTYFSWDIPVTEPEGYIGKNVIFSLVSSVRNQDWFWLKLLAW